jgi:hypothetical protein
MIALSQRLIMPGIISLVLFGVLFYQTEEMLSGLEDPTVVSGWALIALMVLLALINTRKKLIAFNLGGGNFFTSYGIFIPTRAL